MNAKFILGVVAIVAIAAAGDASASQVLTVPASQSHIAYGSNECAYDWNTLGIRPGSDSLFGCSIEFSLPVPSGHVIRQISVLKSCSGIEGSCPGSASVLTELRSLSISGFNDGQEATQFAVNVPLDVDRTNWVQTSNMMTQAGKVFPDSFTVGVDKEYSIGVTMFGVNAEVNGIQITYD
jgi:hypothetical protein